MEAKMETEHSYTEESSSSSSGSSSDSSDGEEEALEPVNILGHVLELPQDLCEDYSIFKEVFSMSTWETLEVHQKEHLKKFLPKFQNNDEDEKEKTVQSLFNYEPFHFSSPLGDFYNNLKQGNYRPDIAKMRKFLMKARAKQQRHKIKSYYAKLLPEVLISRERVLAAAKAAPPGPTPRLSLLPSKSSKNTYKPLYLRAKQRYFEELAAIRGEVGGEESEDENYPEGPPQQMLKKRKHMESGQLVESNVSGTLGHLDSNPTSLQCLKNILAAHRARRQYRENHPELNTTGITMEDIQQRVALVNGTKRLMFGGKHETPAQKMRRGPKKDPNKQKLDRGKKKEESNVDVNPLLPNIKIKCEQENSDSEGSSFVDPVNSPIQRKSLDHMEIKQETDRYPGGKSLNFNDPDLDTVIKQEPLDPGVGGSKLNQPIPIKLEDLDGIDMMALPIEIADESVDVVPNTSTETDDTVDVDESLTETTHANFLSLVRALFPARSAHRASKQELHARCAAVMKSPIAPLNTWYSLSNDWCAELDSALHFLAGERGPHPDEFVPYLQFMKDTKMYQWIGAGRDCDAILGRLCERWLRAVSPAPASNEPAPPRYPTSWVVRPPTTTELAEFRSQERRRYASASKPFTYTQHGYCSVVGPCNSSSSRVGSVLVQERPRSVTLASLLRDAVARLPNGEGNVQQICILLKMSQWIAPCSDQTLLTTVSSALDKLMSIKKDPVVSYDQRTSLWTYLHRHRSEEEWLKSVRSRNKASVTLPNTAPPLVPHSALTLPITTTALTDMEVSGVEEVVENASDSDVDVDDTNLPANTQQLSSAQLLMQATQTTHKLPNKPKGKVIPTPQKPKPVKTTTKTNPIPKQTVEKQQPKPKPTPPIKQTLPTPPKLPKQTPVQKSPTKPTIQKVVQPKPVQVPKTVQVKQTSPSQKQANLMTQAAKQAQQLAQLTKPVVKNVVQKVVTKVQSPKQVVQKTLTPVKQLTPPAKPAPPLVKSATVPVLQPPKSVSITTTKTVPTNVKLRPPVKSESLTSVPMAVVSSQQSVQSSSSITTPVSQQATKLPQGTRSLLIRPPAVHTTVTSVPASAIQTPVTSRRGMVRVLSPATPSPGKSLISPQALLQQVPSTAKKRTNLPNAPTVTTVVQPSTAPTIVSNVNVTPTSRTVQLGGRTVQLANQTVHLPTGQAVQLAGHTLQLSSLQLPTHSVRLPSGQTVQLASSSIQTMRNQAKSQPKPQKNLQIPVSTVQLAGQTVQIGGQTVQLTGHTVKLPSGQSVQVAGQSVQLPSGQTVQLASGNLQTVQLNQNLMSNQTVQIGGQTIQLPSGQTLQLPGGQTLQLPSGQTLQLSGQTLQLASGQTVQLANQQIPKSMAQVVRSSAPSEKSGQPIVAKLVTNQQGQMISLEGMMGPRHIQMSNIRPRAGVRVISPGTRLARPLLLTHKPLHNIILQQGDGSAIRVTSSSNANATQTIVLSNIGAQSATTSTSAAPVLKLQQVNPIQQVKIAQGIKLQQGVTNATVPTSSVRSVLMDGQQLKFLGGRHVLARLLRPAQPPQPPP